MNENYYKNLKHFFFSGMSPRQVSGEYRNQEQRTLIGFGVFFKNSFNELECINIDILSNHLGESAFDTINAFR